MKLPQVFLNRLSQDQKEFTNLLDLTAKVHGEIRATERSSGVIWDASFYNLKTSKIWENKTNLEKESILIALGHKILQEAYFIECAGMAYAARMNLSSKSREEREFFCFVAEEEAKHLRMVEALTDFRPSLDSIPSFAMLIGEIIQEASKTSHLLLIQILLEGWGLSYYKSLAKSSCDENVAKVFKAILKDEIRHHSGGVLLFTTVKDTMDRDSGKEFITYLERISFMVKIGPYNVCEEIFRNVSGADKNMLINFLEEVRAVDTTAEKLKILEQLLYKHLPTRIQTEIQKNEVFKPLSIHEMAEVLFQSMPGIFRPA